MLFQERVCHRSQVARNLPHTEDGEPETVSHGGIWIKTRGSMLLKLLAFRICDSKISGNIVSQVVEDIFFLEAGGNRLCQVILYIEIIVGFLPS